MINSQKFYDRVSGKIPLSEGGSVNIVFLGDSVTHGCFDSEKRTGPFKAYDRFASYTMKFHKMLGTLFPKTVFNIINSGIGGDTANNALSRFDRDVLAYHPDLVVISFGLNDHRNVELYLNALGKMFDRLNELSIPCIYLSEQMMNTYFHPDTTPEYVDYAKETAVLQNSGHMDKVFEGAMALAREKGIAVCDIYNKWKTLSKCGADTTILLANKINHPIPEMHDIIAFGLINTLFFE